MGDIINLRMARKARNRTQAEQKAAENRAKFGRTKAQKMKEQAAADQDERMLRGVKRDREDSQPDL